MLSAFYQQKVRGSRTEITINSISIKLVSVTSYILDDVGESETWELWIGWTRAKKNALIEIENPNWNFFNDEIFAE